MGDAMHDIVIPDADSDPLDLLQRLTKSLQDDKIKDIEWTLWIKVRKNLVAGSFYEAFSVDNYIREVVNDVKYTHNPDEEGCDTPRLKALMILNARIPGKGADRFFEDLP